MKIFISGGCKNGKSYLAQELAKLQATSSLYYVATMQPVDSEDSVRIDRHRAERVGWGFETVEMPLSLSRLIGRLDQNGSILLDSLTAWLMNEMFKPDMTVDSGAPLRMADEINLLCSHFNNIVIVSDFIFSDAAKYDSVVEDYRRALAYADKAAAGACEVVLEVSFGGIIAHRGGKEFYTLYEKAN